MFLYIFAEFGQITKPSRKLSIDLESVPEESNIQEQTSNLLVTDGSTGALSELDRESSDNGAFGSIAAAYTSFDGDSASQDAQEGITSSDLSLERSSKQDIYMY